MKKSLLLFFLLANISILQSQVLNFVDSTSNQRFNNKHYEKLKLKYYLNAAHINSNDIDARFQNAITKLEFGLYDDGYEQLKKIRGDIQQIVKQPTIEDMQRDATICFYMGVAKEYLYDLDSAVYFLKKSVNLNPLLADGFNEIGYIKLNLFEYEEALSYFSKALKIEPKSSTVLYNLGYVNLILGNEYSATRYFEKSIKYGNNDPQTFVMLADINLHKGKKNKAEEYYTQCITADSSLSYSFYKRGVFYFNDNKVEKAYDDILKSYTIDSSFYQSIILLAKIEAKRRNLKKAKQYLEVAVEQIDSQTNLYKCGEYEMIEFRELVKLITKEHHWDDEEYKLINEFVEYVFDGNKNSFQKVLDQVVWNNKKNELVLRMKLFVDFDKSITADSNLINEIIRLNPNLYSIHFLSALQNFKKNRLTEAEECLKKAIEINPSFISPYDWIGVVLKEKKEYDLAREYLSEGIKQSPESAALYNTLGTVEYAEGNNEKAKECYYKSMALDPYYVYPYYNLGQIQRVVNHDYVSAISFYKTSLIINPYYVDAIDNLALSYELMGDYENAEKEYSKLIEYYPENPEYYIKRAAFYDYKEQNDSLALVDYLRGKELGFIHKQIEWHIGDCYFDLGEYSKAIEYYHVTLEKNYTNISVLCSMSKCYFNLSENDSSIFYASKAMEQDSAICEPYIISARAFYAEENYEKAIKYYSNAIATNDTTSNEYAFAFYDRSSTFYYLEEDKKALRDINRAIELDGSIGFFYQLRGLVHRALKDYSNSKLDYKKAYELDSTNKEPLIELVSLYNHMGEIDSAKFYNKIIGEDKNEFDTDIDNLANQAQIARKEGNYLKAIEIFSEAISIEPVGYLFFGRGNVYEDIEEMDLAIRDYRVYMKEVDSCGYCHYAIADNFRSRKNMDSCLYHHSRAVDLSPRNNFYLYHRGKAYAMIRDWANAIADFDKAIEINSDPKCTALSWGEKAKIYEYQSKYDSAINAYKMANSYEKGNFYYARIGVLYQKINQEELARKYIDSVLISEDNYYKTYAAVGLYYSNRKEYQKAITQYEKADGLYPDSYILKSNIGDCNYRMNKLEDAKINFHESLEINPDYVFAKYMLGLIELQQGDFSKSKKYFKEASAWQMEKYGSVSHIVIEDLEKLINKGVKVEEANYIIDEILMKE